MTEVEFADIVLKIKTFYSKEKELLPTPEAVTLWYGMLKDIPKQTMVLFLQKWFATESWSPSVADIRKGCLEIANGFAPDWGEAWKEVQKAIGKYGYNRSDEALNSLSPTTRSAVECIGWRDICMSENADILRSQFRKVYEAQTEREATQNVLPPAVRKAISGLQSLTTREVKELT